LDDHIRSEVVYLFDIDEASRNVHIWISLRCDKEMPVAPLSIFYSLPPGLEAGNIWIDGVKLNDYSIIKIGDNRTIEIDLHKIIQDNPRLDLQNKIQNNKQIDIYLKYKENLSLIKDGNWSQVMINFQSNLSSSSCTLFFCLPKISRTKRLSSYLYDITEREIYELVGFSHKSTIMHKKKFKMLIKDNNKLEPFLRENPKKKNNIVGYFTEEEKTIERLGSFAFCFPKISTKKLISRIILYIITIIISGYVGYLINQFLSAQG